MMRTYIITCLSVCLSMGIYAQNRSVLSITDHIYEIEKEFEGLIFLNELTGFIGTPGPEPPPKSPPPIKAPPPVVVFRDFFALGVLGVNMDNLATQKNVNINHPYFVRMHKTHIIHALNSVGYDVKIDADKKTELYSEDLVRDISSIKGKKLSDLKKEELYSYVYGFYTTYGGDKEIGDTCSLYWDKMYEQPAAMFNLLLRAKSNNITFDSSIFAEGEKRKKYTSFALNTGLFTFVPSQELLEYLKLAQGTSNAYCTERVVK